MNASPNKTPLGSSDRFGRTLGMVQIFSAAILVLSQLAEANRSGLQAAAYVFFSAELILAIGAEVSGRRHGRDSELHIALWWLVGLAFELAIVALIVDSIRQGHQPYFLLAILLVNAFTNFRGSGRSGRNAARRLIGAKSRSLLAKLQVAQPAIVPGRGDRP